MGNMKMKIKHLPTIWFFVFASALSMAQTAIPTFNCMSLYWSPAGGGAEKDVLISYRKTGELQWKQALNLRYNPIKKTSLDRADYRGSVVNLSSGTLYEFKLELQGTTTSATITQHTWSEHFPEAASITVGPRETPYEIKTGGSENAYKVYDGQYDTIDVKHKHQYCLRISASYVIVRNFVLRGAGSGTGAWPPIGAIQIDNGVHDVIIEGCDISDFGRISDKPYMANNGFDRDCGIVFVFGYNIDIQRIIIQNNKIHHPTYTSNNSYHYSRISDNTYTHPNGPQAITMFNNKGNHVIRHNEFYSDTSHMYNDIISGGDNGSYEGVPGPDSDIHGNLLSHCWDNAVELEGGVQNVRCWNNYMTIASDVIGNAAVSIGPLYVWRNVVDLAEWTPDGEAGRFVKMGHAGSESFMSGHMYLFNNTSFQTNGKGVGEGFGGGNRIIKHCISRNNIIHTRTSQTQAISQSKKNLDVDYDYDLYNGTIPANSEAHGIKGLPVYVAGAGYHSVNNTGNFQLETHSPGFDAGQTIPNFTDGYSGNAPDMGAHENGSADFKYGIKSSSCDSNNSSR